MLIEAKPPGRSSGVFARDPGDMRPEGEIVAELVNEAERKRRLGRIPAEPACNDHRVGGISGDIRPRPGARDIGEPVLPQGRGQRLIGLLGGGRLIGAYEGLDETLVGADAVDVRVDAQFVDQPLVIELAPARPGKRHHAERRQPRLAGMGGQRIAVVVIGERGGEHGLAGLARHVHRRADTLRGDLAGAMEAGEVEDDRLDRRIPRTPLDRMDDIAQPVLMDGLRLAEERERILRRGLLDDGAVQCDEQRARDRHRRRAHRGERRIEQTEEQQQKDEDKRVLDDHEKAPGAPDE
jgi:hypothetical protein